MKNTGIGFILGLITAAVLFLPARAVYRWLKPQSAATYQSDARHLTLIDRAERAEKEIAFFGDSITDWWADSAAWSERLVPLGAVSFGIAMDKTTDVIRRIEQGEIDNPAAVVLLVGANDFALESPRPTAEEVARRVQSVVVVIRQRTAAPIILLSILPLPGEHPIRECNALLSRIDDVIFVDVFDRFTSGDSDEPDWKLLPDRVHPGPEGYAIMSEAVVPYIKPAGSTAKQNQR